MQEIKKSVVALNEISSGYTKSGRTLKGIAIVETANKTAQIKVSFTVDIKCDFSLVFAVADDNNLRFYNIGNKQSFTIDNLVNFSWEKGGILLVFDSENLVPVCAGNYKNCPLEIDDILHNFTINLNTISSQKNMLYDDEIIATENYFNYENQPDIQTKIDLAFSEKETETSGGKAQNEFVYNETNFGSSQEKYYEKVISNAKKVLNSNTIFEPLTNHFENSKFVKICNPQEKVYYFGVIYEGDTPKYFCYAIDGIYSFPPPQFEHGAYFIPKSPFDLKGDGYYAIYQDAITGKKI